MHTHTHVRTHKHAHTHMHNVHASTPSLKPQNMNLHARANTHTHTHLRTHTLAHTHTRAQVHPRQLGLCGPSPARPRAAAGREGDGGCCRGAPWSPRGPLKQGAWLPEPLACGSCELTAQGHRLEYLTPPCLPHSATHAPPAQCAQHPAAHGRKCRAGSLLLNSCGVWGVHPPPWPTSARMCATHAEVCGHVCAGPAPPLRRKQ